MAGLAAAALIVALATDAEVKKRAVKRPPLLITAGLFNALN